MKIVSFNTNSGIYEFELEQLDAGWHSHPAMEVILATGNSLQLETDDQFHENLAFVIIDANVRHKVYSNHPVQLWMIEGSIARLQALYKIQNLPLKKGVYAGKGQENIRELSGQFSRLQHTLELSFKLDTRVKLCLDYFKTKEISYPDMMQALQAETHLSESRLSHLFKQEMGLSLKKYLVWSRLRETIQYVLSEEISLYEAGLKSGFFDQAHLSKAFKQMLGLSPSKVYNSRMIQE